MKSTLKIIPLKAKNPLCGEFGAVVEMIMEANNVWNVKMKSIIGVLVIRD